MMHGQARIIRASYEHVGTSYVCRFQIGEPLRGARYTVWGVLGELIIDEDDFEIVQAAMPYVSWHKVEAKGVTPTAQQ